MLTCTTKLRAKVSLLFNCAKFLHHIEKRHDDLSVYTTKTWTQMLACRKQRYSSQAVSLKTRDQANLFDMRGENIMTLLQHKAAVRSFPNS